MRGKIVTYAAHTREDCSQTLKGDEVWGPILSGSGPRIQILLVASFTWHFDECGVLSSKDILNHIRINLLLSLSGTETNVKFKSSTVVVVPSTAWDFIQIQLNSYIEQFQTLTRLPIWLHRTENMLDHFKADDRFIELVKGYLLIVNCEGVSTWCKALAWPIWPILQLPKPHTLLLSWLETATVWSPPHTTTEI